MSFDRNNFFTVGSREVKDYRGILMPILRGIEVRTDQFTAEDVLNTAEAGRAQLWAYAIDGEVRAVAATQLHEFTRGKLCTIWVVAGFDALDIFDAAHAEIEAWARDIGCYAIEIVGREGWQRVLPGYVKTAVVLEKPLQKAH